MAFLLMKLASGNGIHNKLNILHTSLNMPIWKGFFSQRSSVEWDHISLVLPLGVQFSISLTQEAIESFALPGKIDEIENVSIDELLTYVSYFS